MKPLAVPFSTAGGTGHGGLSLPKIASDLALREAERHGLGRVAPRAGLVPLTWRSVDKLRFEPLAGLRWMPVATGGASFRENLFTHRG